MAANVGVGAGMSSAVASVTGSSLTENFDATFALAADILLTPTFPQEEFDRYKTRTRTGLIAAAEQSGLPRERDVLARDLRHASRARASR